MIKLKTVIPIANIEQATLDGAYKIFKAYKDEGIIKNSSFDNSTWLLCNETANVSLDFNFSKEDYLLYQPLLKESFDSFVEKAKTCILYKLGSLALPTLRSYVLSLKQMIGTPPDCISSINETRFILDRDRLLEFIKMFEKENNTEEINFLTSEISILPKKHSGDGNNSQRVLAAYSSYLLFREKINQFWSESVDEEEKLFFFPVWMWWQVTSIIPMRPIEFVLTPRKCLTFKKGEWYLKIRKNGIKGSKRTIKYRINEDYYFETLIITPEIANTIKWYIEKTDCYASTELETLFVTDTHYKRWDCSKPYTSRYFTYVNLHTCLNYFYEFILKDYYGLEIIEDKERSFINSNEIQRISLGDTRQLSTIDAINSGVPASAVSVLCGHSSIDMTATYFSNVDKFIDCETYRAHNRLIKQKNVFNYSEINELSALSNKDISECDFDNCLNSIGPNGEIGYCSKCRFYPPNRHLTETMLMEKRQFVKDNAVALYKISNLYRKKKVDKEDFMIAYQKFLGSKYSYTEYLMEMKGIEDGKKKKN